MKLWEIEIDNELITIDIDNITILKGFHRKWFNLARAINEYFNNKFTEVKIYEDSQLINKKDWECTIIPFDTALHLDKITSKSPLQTILNQIVNYLTISPQYQSIIEEWELLKEEEKIINETLVNKYNLQFELKQFEEQFLKEFILLKGINKNLTPIDMKILFLKLLLDKEVSKKQLIIIEMLELYASNNELKEVYTLIKQLQKRGYNFIIITNETLMYGCNNYLSNDQIINKARIELLKNKVISLAPVPLDENDFEKGKNLIIEAVDNCLNLTEIFNFKKVIHKKEMVVIYLILNLIGINVDIDITEFPPNLRHYFSKGEMII